MPLAGAGFGASKALEQILAEQMVQAQMQAREREAQARTQLDQQRLEETIRQNDINNQQQNRVLDAQDASRRQNQNIVGVRRMIGDSLRQRTGALNPEDMRDIAALQIEAGDSPNLSALAPPKPERDPIADYEAKAKINARYRKPTGGAGGEKKQPLVVTMPDGSIQDLNGVLPPGAVPYDQVAARSSKPKDSGEAVDTAQEVKRLAAALVGHKGFGGVFGLAGSYVPTIRQDTADAEQLLRSLTGMLTIENMDKMKGVLSDSDMRVLRQASTTLDPRMGDEAARSELNRLIEVMGRVGAASGPMAPMSSHGGEAPKKKTAQELIAQYGAKKP